jgi:hypothetical protein
VSCLLKFIEKHIQNSSSLARWDDADTCMLSHINAHTCMRISTHTCMLIHTEFVLPRTLGRCWCMHAKLKCYVCITAHTCMRISRHQHAPHQGGWFSLISLPRTWNLGLIHDCNDILSRIQSCKCYVCISHKRWRSQQRATLHSSAKRWYYFVYWVVYWVVYGVVYWVVYWVMYLFVPESVQVWKWSGSYQGQPEAWESVSSAHTNTRMSNWFTNISPISISQADKQT